MEYQLLIASLSACRRKRTGGALEQSFRKEIVMPVQRKEGGAREALKDYETGGGQAGKRSGKGGKGGGGLGGQDAGGIKGGGKRKTHAGTKKGSPGGLTSD
jgi:hypothetical protein